MLLKVPLAVVVAHILGILLMNGYDRYFPGWNNNTVFSLSLFN